MRWRYLLLFCEFLLVFVDVAVAEHRYRSRITLDGRALQAEANTAAVAGRSFKPLRITIHDVVGIGTVPVLLNRRKLPSAEAFIFRQGIRSRDTAVPVLFKGILLRKLHTDGHRERRRVAISIINGKAQLQFQGGSKLRARMGTRRRSRVYTVSWKLSRENSSLARVTSVPSSAFGGKACAAGIAHQPLQHAMRHTEDKRPLQVRALSERSADLYRVLTISTDADPEWYARYGEGSNAEIAAIVNAAEAIYERQLRMRFALVRQHVYADASPYVSTNASQLLATFAANPENPANLTYAPLTFDQDVDLKHLFTGKDLDGTTVGLAYVGSVCWAPKSAYGLTQNITRDFNVAIFSHELGHSVGAQHDTTDPGSLMYPTLTMQGYFSSASVDQINRFLSYSGTCVIEQMLAPNLSNATLTLKKKRSKSGTSVRLYGTLVSASQKPIVGEVIKLTINDRERFVRTDDAGGFSYTLKSGRSRVSSAKVRKIVVSAEIGSSGAAITAALRISTRVLLAT